MLRWFYFVIIITVYFVIIMTAPNSYVLEETINSITLEAVMLFGVLIYVVIELQLM